MTECTQKEFQFQRLGRRQVGAAFDGGQISSDGGALLLREVEARLGIVRQFAACFRDFRDPRFTQHSLLELLTQRTFGIALGYEDLNDHDALRVDPLLGLVVGREDLSPLAGKSTLNRLELRGPGAGPDERYKKIEVQTELVERFFLDVFVQSHRKPPSEVVLDFDSTDDPIHGRQEGRFFHGYYGNYCYLPLYVFAGRHLLCAKLRPANIDAAAGSLELLQQIVARLRAAWPNVRIVVRADSGFARDAMMTWCEANGVYYLLGLARNGRLSRAIGRELQQARRRHEKTGRPARVFRELRYRTRSTWSRSRRVVAKAEHIQGKANPRFVVTNIPAKQVGARELYEKLYCARGDMENRIKEQQLGLFADRTSSATMRANQLRLWFSSVAYVVLEALRRLGLRDTDLETAQCSTIRLKLLKIGALVQISVRRVRIALASGYPHKAAFASAFDRLLKLPTWQGSEATV